LIFSRFDIIIDADLKPWLLEVNYTPSFKCDTELDLRVKRGVIKDALNLINLTLNTVDFSDNVLENCETIIQNRKVILEIQDAQLILEEKTLQNHVRIYPTKVFKRKSYLIFMQYAL